MVRGSRLQLNEGRASIWLSTTETVSLEDARESVSGIRSTDEHLFEREELPFKVSDGDPMRSSRL